MMNVTSLSYDLKKITHTCKMADIMSVTGKISTITIIMIIILFISYPYEPSGLFI